MTHLPVDILELIVDELSYPLFDIVSLRSCALAGRGFLKRCQQHIFREIVVVPDIYQGYGWWKTLPSSECGRLVEIFKNNRELGGYVKELVLLDGPLDLPKEVPLGERNWIYNNVDFPQLLEAIPKLDSLCFGGIDQDVETIWSSWPQQTVSAFCDAIHNVTRFDLHANIYFESPSELLHLFHAMPHLRELFLRSIEVMHTELASWKGTFTERNRPTLGSLSIRSMTRPLCTGFLLFLMDPGSPFLINDLTSLTVALDSVEGFMIARLLELQSNEKHLKSIDFRFDDDGAFDFQLVDQSSDCPFTIDRFKSIERIKFGGVNPDMPNPWVTKIMAQLPEISTLREAELRCNIYDGSGPLDLSFLTIWDAMVDDSKRFPKLRRVYVMVMDQRDVAFVSEEDNLEEKARSLLPRLLGRDEVKSTVIVKDMRTFS